MKQTDRESRAIVCLLIEHTILDKKNIIDSMLNTEYEQLYIDMAIATKEREINELQQALKWYNRVI